VWRGPTPRTASPITRITPAPRPPTAPPRH
jgi:hypothetical protein